MRETIDLRGMAILGFSKAKIESVMLHSWLRGQLL